MLTLQQIHTEVERIDHRLEELVAEIAEARDTATVCEATWKTELAKVRLTARDSAESAGKKQPTQDWLEDLAHRDAENAYRAHLYADANVETLRDALRATTTRADLMRTLAASYRTAGG